MASQNRAGLAFGDERIPNIAPKTMKERPFMKTYAYLIIVLVGLICFTPPAISQDQTLTDAKNNVNIAIIKLGAMIELNNQRILQLNRDASQFDEQMQKLITQQAKLNGQIAKAKQPKVQDPPDNKNP